MRQGGFIPIIILFVTVLIGLVSYIGVKNYKTISNVLQNTTDDSSPSIEPTDEFSLSTATPPSNQFVVTTPQTTARPSTKKTSTPKPTSTPIKTASPTNTPTNTNNQTPTTTAAPTPAPTPTPQSYPQATSCSSVTVTGATYSGNVNGKDLYYVSSGASITLHANTTPSDGKVSWKTTSCSSKLPNCGSFSTNNTPTTTFTAPTNTSGSDQGVEIRGDISEYPNQWLYCPPFTIGVYTQ